MSALPSEMNAVEIREPGGPEVLQPTVCALPQPRAGEVLVAVHAAGVNRPDCLQRAGLYPVPPDASPLPGLEIAGEVVALGEGAQRWSVGDRVVALTHGGGYAEYCTAHAGHCLPWPDGLSAAEAATLPETCFTVQHNLFQRGALAADDTILVHGGSSGIGTTAIQLARAAGATVIVTAGSTEKCDYCLEVGAHRAINYREQDFEAVISEEFGKAGLNVVLDMVAGPYVEKNLRLLGPDGRYVMIAFLMGATAEVNFGQILGKRLLVTGSTLRPQSVAAKTAIAGAVEQAVWPLVNSGSVRSHIHARWPLAEAAAAHVMMESSAHVGKLVLDVRAS